MSSIFIRQPNQTGRFVESFRWASGASRTNNPLDEFYKRWVDVCPQALADKTENSSVDDMVCWHMGVAYLDRPHLEARRPLVLTRAGLCLDVTATGSSTCVERLFGHGRIFFTPQRGGNMTIENKRVAYILLNVGKISAEQLLRTHRVVDGTGVILVSVSISRLQHVWTRVQRSYQGANNYRKCNNELDGVFVAQTKHRAGILTAKRQSSRHATASFGALDANSNLIDEAASGGWK